MTRPRPDRSTVHFKVCGWSWLSGFRCCWSFTSYWPATVEGWAVVWQWFIGFEVWGPSCNTHSDSHCDPNYSGTPWVLPQTDPVPTVSEGYTTKQDKRVSMVCWVLSRSFQCHEGGSLLMLLNHHGNICWTHNLVQRRLCSEFRIKIDYIMHHTFTKIPLISFSEVLFRGRGFLETEAIHWHFLMIHFLNATDFWLNAYVICASYLNHILTIPPIEVVHSQSCKLCHSHCGFFATGTYMHSVGDAENLSKSTVCHALRKDVLALTELLNMFVVFPGHVSTLSIKETFYKLTGIMN